MDSSENAVRDFEQALNDTRKRGYVLQLYIAGSSPRSQRAVVNVQRMCRDFLTEACELQVIDIFQQPHLAKAEQIFAVPTLIKRFPAPRRLFIGDMSEVETILAGLDS